MEYLHPALHFHFRNVFLIFNMLIAKFITSSNREFKNKWFSKILLWKKAFKVQLSPQIPSSILYLNVHSIISWSWYWKKNFLGRRKFFFFLISLCEISKYLYYTYDTSDSKSMIAPTSRKGKWGCPSNHRRLREAQVRLSISNRGYRHDWSNGHCHYWSSGGAWGQTRRR